MFLSLSIKTLREFSLSTLYRLHNARVSAKWRADQHERTKAHVDPAKFYGDFSDDVLRFPR